MSGWRRRSPGGYLGIHRGVVLADSAATIDALTIAGATDLGGYSVGVSIEEPSSALVEAPILVKIRDAEIKVHTTRLGNQAYAVAVSTNHLELRDSIAEASTNNFWGYTAGLVGTDDTLVTVYGSTLRGTGDGGRGVASGSAIDSSSPTIILHHSWSKDRPELTKSRTRDFVRRQPAPRQPAWKRRLRGSLRWGLHRAKRSLLISGPR